MSAPTTANEFTALGRVADGPVTALTNEYRATKTPATPAPTREELNAAQRAALVPYERRRTRSRGSRRRTGSGCPSASSWAMRAGPGGDERDRR